MYEVCIVEEGFPDVFTVIADNFLTRDEAEAYIEDCAPPDEFYIVFKSVETGWNDVSIP